MPVWIWAAGGGAVLATIWIVSPWRELASTAMAFLPAAAVALGISLYRPPRLGAWRFFAIGLVMQFVGVVIMTVVGGPPVDPATPAELPSIAAVMLVPGGMLLQLIGAFRIVRAGPSFDRWSGLDTGVIIAAFGFAIWFLILDPAFDAGARSLVPVPVLLLILLIDLLFLELGLRLLFAAENRQPAFWLFLGSTGCVVASQLAFTSQVVQGTYVFGGLTDLGWQAANVGWAVMALHPSMVGLVASVPGMRGGAIPMPRLLTMSLAALIVPGILVADALVPGHEWNSQHLLIAGIGSGIVLLMVILRMAGALSELRRQGVVLRRSEERYRTLVEQSSDAIFVLDPHGRIAEVNATGGALLGYPADDLVGRAWADLVAPEDLAAQPLHFADLRTGRSLLFARHLQCADGTIVPVELSAKLLPDGRFLHVARDITERLQADAERASLDTSLRESRRDLEEAQAIAHVGSWTLDPGTGQATWSAEMYRILGLDPAGPAVDLANISKLFTPASVLDVGAAIERAVTTGEPWHLGLETVRPDGTHGWVTSNGIAERDDTGAVIKIRGTMQDVTEQRQLEGQLRQAQRLEAVGQLAGGIAHDFNNLLTAIRGYAELVRRNLAAEDRNRADVEQVMLAADRAAELTRQLLAFSRRQVLQPRVLDPATIVTSIAPMLERLLGEHIELITHAAPGVGRVRVDPSQFEQVIVNLAVNAGDAMPAGGKLTIETVNVEIDAAYAAVHAEVTPGPHVALVVSDTGTGMDEVTKPRIFEPFFTTKEPGKGTGMGLATVYGIVKQSGGSVYVYSEPGHGTSFKVYLPRVEEAAESDTIITPVAGVQTCSEVILLVEDDPAVRAFAARILTEQGYAVLEAGSGAEALALAAAHPDAIDLLVTDVIMPGLQGHQLALELAAERPGLRVLYVSGFTENSVVHHGVVGDGVAFLPKPFSGEALGRAVRQALEAPA